MGLEGKTVLITGAASGLGRQLSLDLAQQRVQLVLADQDREGLLQTLGSVQKLGCPAAYRRVDVAIEGDCAELVAFAIEQFGGIDFLVLCAGISMWARFDEITNLKVFRRLLDVNYLGAVYCIHAALPFLKESHGTIVAISSLQGEVAIPRHTGYSASKHALNGFLEALEMEVGRRIRILNVMPGWITGTGLRAKAFKAGAQGGGTHAKSGNASVTVEECSRLIIRAMRADTRMLFAPRKLKALLWLKVLAPSLLKRIISRAVDAQDH